MSQTARDKLSSDEEQTLKAYTPELPEVEEKKDKLLHEIQMLQHYILETETKIDLRQFGYVRRSEDLSKQQLQWERDLYRFAGITCTEFDSEYVFQFSAGRKVTERRVFSVQIRNVSGKGELGRWALPMSVDMDEILEEYPLDNLQNIYSFVRCCKRHVDCYVCREDQYEELKDTIAIIENCELRTNYGYTKINLNILRIKSIDNGETYDVSLYLFYNSNEATPMKLVLEMEDDTSDNIISMLKKFFKPFSKFYLKDAFEKLVNTPRFGFIWEKILKDDDIVEISKSDSETIGFLNHIKKRKKSTKDEKNRSVNESNAKSVDVDNELAEPNMCNLSDHEAENLHRTSIRSPNNESHVTEEGGEEGRRKEENVNIEKGAIKRKERRKTMKDSKESVSKRISPTQKNAHFTKSVNKKKKITNSFKPIRPPNTKRKFHDNGIDNLLMEIIGDDSTYDAPEEIIKSPKERNNISDEDVRKDKGFTESKNEKSADTEISPVIAKINEAESYSEILSDANDSENKDPRLTDKKKLRNIKSRKHKTIRRRDEKVQDNETGEIDFEDQSLDKNDNFCHSVSLQSSSKTPAQYSDTESLRRTSTIKRKTTTKPTESNTKGKTSRLNVSETKLKSNLKPQAVRRKSVKWIDGIRKETEKGNLNKYVEGTSQNDMISSTPLTDQIYSKLKLSCTDEISEILFRNNGGHAHTQDRRSVQTDEGKDQEAKENESESSDEEMQEEDHDELLKDLAMAAQEVSKSFKRQKISKGKSFSRRKCQVRK